MRFLISCDDSLREGVSLLSKELGFTLCEGEDFDLSLRAVKTEEDALSVTLSQGSAVIRYGSPARFFRGLAILCQWLREGKEQASCSETPLFKTNGAMVDMSRNVVMNVATVKCMLRKMALMGLNTFMLYTEDTYELREHPYFGHMRGRYTEEELKELDAYAGKLGIELIPCIQMLGHLSTHLQWAAAAPYRDGGATLLVGADETYRLIGHMLDAVCRCFTTKRIHIGMDETFDLGRGKYLDKNGYRDPMELYFEHLERVTEMVRARGLEPMMWSDMFFRLAGKDLPGYDDYDERVVFTEEVAKKIPKGVQQVYWDYYHKSADYYAGNIDKHTSLFGETPIFAGGIWTWSGHCPLFSRSLDRTLPALDACRDRGVREIFATIWDNGAENNMIVSLAGLAWYADYDYRGYYDEESVKSCFIRSCGVSYDDMMKLELPDHPDGGQMGLSRGFLYNDPLLGLIDKHIEGLEVQNYYAKVEKELTALGDMGIFAPAHHTILKLTAVLKKKTDFGVRLKAAYDGNNRQILQAMVNECEEIRLAIEELRTSHRASWMVYNKPLGWELMEVRYGGLIARFETTGFRLAQYLEGNIDRIEELEEPRLRLDGQLSENATPRFHSLFNWMDYRDYTVAGRF